MLGERRKGEIVLICWWEWEGLDRIFCVVRIAWVCGRVVCARFYALFFLFVGIVIIGLFLWLFKFFGGKVFFG